MNINLLQAVNFSLGEIKVYRAILYLGLSNIKKIHEKTGFERRAIYDILNKLIYKGYVIYNIENGKKIYKCAPLYKLKEEIEKKQKEITAFKNIIPQIQDIYDAQKSLISFEIFRGKEGIKTVFEDMLNYKNIFVIGGGLYIVKKLPYYWSNYNKRRKTVKSQWNNLIREDKKYKILETELINYKILPKEFNKNPVVIIIFGNKVVNLLWGEEWMAFVIESKEIAENYKGYHQYLWKTL